MEYEDRKLCDGPSAKPGDLVSIQYYVALSEEALEAGDLVEGRDENEPITIELSEEKLLGSVYEAILGMRAGGSIRRIRIPSEEAFGRRGLGERVPPNDPLVVDICLRAVTRIRR